MLTVGSWKKQKQKMQTAAIHALSEDLKLYDQLGQMQQSLEKQGLRGQVSGVPVPSKENEPKGKKSSRKRD